MLCACVCMFDVQVILGNSFFACRFFHGSSFNAFSEHSGDEGDIDWGDLSA